MKKYLFLVIICAFGMMVYAQSTLLKSNPIVSSQQVDDQKGNDWLLKSHWTQDYPYNSMCPRDPVTNTSSYAGCPAIAMGQIINYLGTTQGTRFDDNDDYHHGYYGRNYDIDDDWESLGFPSFPQLNEYLDQADSIYQAGGELDKELCAAIVFACGTACTQVYTSSGSGTFQVEQAYDAFKRFGFDDCVLFKEPTEEMHALLQQNLRDGYPAHLAVESPDLQSGHNVVVDGYRESDGKYHMNFGYGGSIDGWYYIPDPNFYYGLTKLEGIILNIIPKTKSIENLYVSSTGYAMWSVAGKPNIEFSVKLNGEEVGTTSYYAYQFATEGLVPETTYTASVAAIENGNVGEYSTTSWVYIPCDHYDGMQDASAWNDGGDVHLDWTLPEVCVNTGDANRADPYGLAMKISGTVSGGSQYDGKALGTMIYRDGEFLIYMAVGEELHQSYIDENMGDENHEYTFQVVYDGDDAAAPAIGNYYAMSCPDVVEYIPTSVDENIENQFVIYPNPAKDVLYFNLDGKELNYSIYSVSGQKVMDGFASEYVNISKLGKGLYIIKIGEMTEKIIIE